MVCFSVWNYNGFFTTPISEDLVYWIWLLELLYVTSENNAVNFEFKILTSITIWKNTIK